MVDPTTPSTAFAATYKHGLYKTTDAGRTWRYSGIGQGVRSVAVDPQSTSTVYAGTWRRGLYKSTDGGDNWQIIGFRGWGVLALAFDPRASTTLYAGTEKAGVWRSTDGGAHWTEKNSGGLGRPPYLEVRALAIDRLAPDTLYVSIGYGANRLFKSTDGGDSWRSLRTGLSALALDPRTPSVVYAASTYSATYKSTNGGRSWRPVAGLKAPVQALLITQETGTIYAGTSSSGVFVSADHGRTWRSFNRGLDIRRSSKPGRTIPTVNALSSGAAGRLLYAGTAGGGVFVRQLPG